MKKILLIGFIVVLLIAIPVTVFLVQQQQKTKSGAVAATTISILPASQAPIHVGDTASLIIKVDPTTVNQVSLVKFTISYDSTKLSLDNKTGFTVSGSPNLLTAIKGPVYTTGSVAITLSAGGSPQNVIQTPTTVGTITFTALATTDTAPTQITFGTDTQVLSLGTSDQFNENVLASANPAALVIIGGAVTPTPIATPTAALTPTPTGNAPICSSLTADTTSGAAPLSTNLTVTGTSNNSTISKITFNFGDSQSQDITASGGIGTNSVSVLQSHTYTTSGTFNATATLTDATNAVSNSNCSVSITVGGQTTTTGTSTTTTTTQQTVVVTPAPLVTLAAQPSPLPPTGPADLVKVGSIGAILTVIGAVLLFAL